MENSPEQQTDFYFQLISKIDSGVDRLKIDDEMIAETQKKIASASEELLREFLSGNDEEKILYAVLLNLTQKEKKYILANPTQPIIHNYYGYVEAFKDCGLL